MAIKPITFLLSLDNMMNLELFVLCLAGNGGYFIPPYRRDARAEYNENQVTS